MTEHAGESQLVGSSNHNIENLTLAIANYEYSYTLPYNTRKIGIRLRSLNDTAKISFTQGESGTRYLTVPPGGWWHDFISSGTAKVLYIQSETDGLVAEIEAWS